MPLIFLKLLIGNVMMLIWYLLYRVFLARSTQYQLNRVYLLSALIIPVILVLLDINPITREFQRLDTAIARLADQPALIRGYSQIIGTKRETLFLYMYTFGLVSFSAKLLLQALSLRRIHRYAQIRNVLGVPVRELREDLPAFSFWRWIYLNPELYSKEDTELILHHENIHIRQWHTIDIMAARAIAILLWFNPVSLMIFKAIQQNLEYIADREVLRLGVDPRKYQYSLLKLSMNKLPTELTNLYASTDLRKRIVQMNRSGPSFMIKVWSGIVPALAMACLCLVNIFQLHIAGHHAFYQQMIDPEFLQLQARAEGQRQREALHQFKPEQSGPNLNVKQGE